MNKSKIGIYFISLEKDTERRNVLKHNFKNNYDSMNHISAVNGKELTANEYFIRVFSYFNNTQNLLTPGELGCLMSHEKALKTFLDSDNDYAIIFEDDVIGYSEDIDTMKNIISQFKTKFFLHLGGMDGCKSSKYIYGKDTHIKGVYKAYKFSWQHLWRACAYALDKQTASKILNVYIGNNVVADEWGKILKKIETDIYVSNIFHHPIDLCDSNLEKARMNNKRKEKIAKIIVRRAENIISLIYFKLKGLKNIYYSASSSLK